MKVKFLLLLLLVCSLTSNAQNHKSAYTIIATNGEGMSIDKRASLRIMLSHMSGSELAAYQLKDKSFFIISTDETTAETLRRKVKSEYPLATVQQTEKGNYQQSGYSEVTQRVIKSDAGFPVYVLTGDNELDERSYAIEKEHWLQQNPQNSK